MYIVNRKFRSDRLSEKKSNRRNKKDKNRFHLELTLGGNWNVQKWLNLKFLTLVIKRPHGATEDHFSRQQGLRHVSTLKLWLFLGYYMSVDGGLNAEFIVRDNMDCGKGNIANHQYNNVGSLYSCGVKCAEYGPGCKGNGYD